MPPLKGRPMARKVEEFFPACLKESYTYKFMMFNCQQVCFMTLTCDTPVYSGNRSDAVISQVPEGNLDRFELFISRCLTDGAANYDAWKALNNFMLTDMFVCPSVAYKQDSSSLQLSMGNVVKWLHIIDSVHNMGESFVTKDNLLMYFTDINKIHVPSLGSLLDSSAQEFVKKSFISWNRAVARGSPLTSDEVVLDKLPYCLSDASLEKISDMLYSCCLETDTFEKWQYDNIPQQCKAYAAFIFLGCQDQDKILSQMIEVLPTRAQSRLYWTSDNTYGHTGVDPVEYWSQVTEAILHNMNRFTTPLWCELNIHKLDTTKVIEIYSVDSTIKGVFEGLRDIFAPHSHNTDFVANLSTLKGSVSFESIWLCCLYLKRPSLDVETLWARTGMNEKDQEEVHDALIGVASARLLCDFEQGDILKRPASCDIAPDNKRQHIEIAKRMEKLESAMGTVMEFLSKITPT